jgi:hypothetical protein
VDKQLDSGSDDSDNSVLAKEEEEKEPANQEGDIPIKSDEDSELKNEYNVNGISKAEKTTS